MTDSESELPSTWLSLKLGDVLAYGKTEKAEPEEIAPETWVLELEDVEKDTTKVLQHLTFAERQSKSTKNKFNAGDVLYGKLRPYLNKVTFADRPGVCTTEIVPIKPNEAVHGRYLFHWLRHPAFLTYVTEVSHGVNMPRLGTDAGRDAPFVLAPKAEQKRIADKLDTVLTRVDAVNTRLVRVAPLLKRFRQSVLAAATSGRLTEDWRAGQPDISEWKTEKLNDLGELGRGKSKHRPRNDPRLYGGVHPFVQTGDVANANQWITSHKQTYSDFGLDQSKLWPANTLCITIAANIADTALLSYPACFPDSVVGFVANEACCLPRFIKWSIDVRKDDLERLAPATAQKNINLGVLEEVEIHLPSLEEQTEIVRRVETLFAFADRLEARLAQAQTAATRLTPALLAKAFRGELVPQDPNDEPAAELLRRLQAQRASAPKASTGRGRKAAVQV